MKDPVSDLLTQIKNALQRKKDLVDLTSSYFKEEIVRVLFEEGFVSRYEVLSRGGKKILRIALKYGFDKYGKPSKAVINEIKQVSKPGKRIYSQVAKIPRVQSGFGISIVSTPSGIMTGDAAKKKKVGGEIIAYVY